MFFEISKLLNIFISPVTWVILLLVASFLLKKERVKRFCRYASLAVFLLFSNGLLFEWLKYQTVKESCVVPPDTTRTYKVAIVMGGFAYINKETRQMRYEQDRADRLWEAVRLWKLGRVEKILITGDPSSVIRPDGSSTADLFLSYMQEMGVLKDAFVLEQHALNTRQNALYTSKILKDMNIQDRDCLLITSATHMERSLKCFAKEELFPDYYPVNVYDKPEQISHRSFYPSWEVAVKWQELINEWIGNAVYELMGYR